ncbi:hypothetical protein I3760_01G093400, partial [Carya illinoinensis]
FCILALLIALLSSSSTKVTLATRNLLGTAPFPAPVLLVPTRPSSPPFSGSSATPKSVILPSSQQTAPTLSTASTLSPLSSTQFASPSGASLPPVSGLSTMPKSAMPPSQTAPTLFAAKLPSFTPAGQPSFSGISTLSPVLSGLPGLPTMPAPTNGPLPSTSRIPTKISSIPFLSPP